MPVLRTGSGFIFEGPALLHRIGEMATLGDGKTTFDELMQTRFFGPEIRKQFEGNLRHFERLRITVEVIDED